MPNRADPALKAPFAVLTIVYSYMGTECSRRHRVAISAGEPPPTKVA